jgi:hypothetical protein
VVGVFLVVWSVTDSLSFLFHFLGRSVENCRLKDTLRGHTTTQNQAGNTMRRHVRTPRPMGSDQKNNQESTRNMQGTHTK